MTTKKHLLTLNGIVEAPPDQVRPLILDVLTTGGDAGDGDADVSTVVTRADGGTGTRPRSPPTNEGARRTHYLRRRASNAMGRQIRLSPTIKKGTGSIRRPAHGRRRPPWEGRLHASISPTHTAIQKRLRALSLVTMAPVQAYEPGVTHQLTRHETLCAALERGHPLSAAHTDRLHHTSANSVLADERFRNIRRPDGHQEWIRAVDLRPAERADDRELSSLFVVSPFCDIPGRQQGLLR